MTKEKLTLTERMEAKTKELQERKANGEKLTFKTMKKKHWAGAISAGLVLGIGFAVMIDTASDAPKAEPTKAEAQVKNVAVTDWESAIEEIMTRGGTPTEKFDATMSLANDYKPSEGEFKRFQTYILTEYVSGQYLQNMKDDKYTLGMMFRAQVIEHTYDDKKQVPMDKISFDMLQNLKYVYRGIDKIGSQAVLDNEEQINKVLQASGMFEN